MRIKHQASGDPNCQRDAKHARRGDDSSNSGGEEDADGDASVNDRRNGAVPGINNHFVVLKPEPGSEHADDDRRLRKVECLMLRFPSPGVRAMMKESANLKWAKAPKFLTKNMVFEPPRTAKEERGLRCFGIAADPKKHKGLQRGDWLMMHVTEEGRENGDFSKGNMIPMDEEEHMTRFIVGEDPATHTYCVARPHFHE